MTSPRDVAVFVGSLRTGSYTRLVAKALVTLAPPALALDLVDIGRLPFYNEDLDTANPPAEWVALRQRVRRAVHG